MDFLGDLPFKHISPAIFMFSGLRPITASSGADSVMVIFVHIGQQKMQWKKMVLGISF